MLYLLTAAPAAAIDLFVRGLRDGEVAFGRVELTLEVLSAAPVAFVEARLDGELVVRLEAPPWRLTVDLGDDNRPRVLELTATDVDGASASRRIVTGALEIDERLDLELQQLYVTVTRDGRRLLDLDAAAFEVFDDGRRQQAVTFERGDVPLAAVVLIDSSLSMTGDALAAALAAARAFVESLAPLDEAKVVLFSDRLLAATPFTGDPAVLRRDLGAVGAAGGTAICDHLYLALKELDPRQGRRVVVLLSDGHDVDSVLDMADVEWKAGRSQSLIYWIRPSPPEDPAIGYLSVWRDADAHRREVEALERLVAESGGRIRAIERLEQAADAFREILRELREQYVLGYYPSVDRNDGAWHDVEVRVKAPGVRVRARGGYYDDDPDPGS